MNFSWTKNRREPSPRLSSVYHRCEYECKCRFANVITLIILHSKLYAEFTIAWFHTVVLLKDKCLTGRVPARHPNSRLWRIHFCSLIDIGIEIAWELHSAYSLYWSGASEEAVHSHDGQGHFIRGSQHFPLKSLGNRLKQTNHPAERSIDSQFSFMI